MSHWDKKRVLVTGGAGFVGSYLCEYLVEAGADVTVADNLSRTHDCENLKNVWKSIDFKLLDLSVPKQAREAVLGQEVVFNLAAKVTGIEYNINNNYDMMRSNLDLQLNVLEAACNYGVKDILQVSTACIYPHDAPVPTPESSGGEGSPEKTNEGYGYAKLLGEKASLYMAKQHGKNVKICRPFNAYGARDHYDEGTSHVVPALIKRVMDGEDPVVIWGTGKQTRSFVHARDLAKGMMLVCEKAPSGAILNIGHDQEVSIRTLFEVICRVSGKSPRVEFDLFRPDGYSRRAADTTLLKAVTGWVPDTPLEEGIREMVQEYAGS